MPRADGSASPDPRRAVDRLRAAGPTIAATAPYLAFAVLVLANLWVDRPLGGDQGVLELWTRSALHGDALVGPYSRFGWNHPGPIAFYVFAPGYALSGQRPGGLALGALAVNVACLAVLVRGIQRQVGVGQAHLAAIVSVGFLVVAGTTWFDEPWNPVLVVVPLVLAGVAAARVVSGVSSQLWVAAAAATFCVQTHVGTLPVAAACTGLATGSVVVRAVRHRQAPWRDVAVAAAVSVALWLPPVVQQLTGHPGNLRLLASFFRSSSGHHGAHEVADVSVASVSWSGTDLIHRALFPEALPGATAWRLAWLAIVVLCVTVGGVTAWRAGRRLEPSLALVAVTSLAALLVGLTRANGPLEEYLALPSLAVGHLLVLSLVLTTAPWVAAHLSSTARARAVGALPWASAAVAAFAVAAIVATHPSRDLYVRMATPASEPTLTHLEAALDGAGAVNLDIASHDAWPEAVLVANQLERDGVAVRVPEEWRFLFGEQRTGQRCGDPVVSVRRADTADPDAEPLSGDPVGSIGPSTVAVDPAGRLACDAP